MNNIILKNFLKNIAINESNENYNYQINKVFNSINNNDIFNVIGKNKFALLFIILLVIFGGLIRVQISQNIFFSLIVICILFYIYYNYEINNLKSYTNNSEQKLLFLNTILSNSSYNSKNNTLTENDNFIDLDNYSTKSYLYKNPICVQFYYNNKELIKYSIYNFQQSLKAINAMILINEQIQLNVNNLKNQYNELLLLQNMCLNYFQAIIYSLPTTNITNNKFTKSLKILQEITNNIIDKSIKKIKEINKKNGININYFPIYKNEIKPNDTKSFNYNNTFDFYN